jgi:hypothetical protein
VIRHPDGGVNAFAIIMALLAGIAMRRFQIGVVPILVICGSAGIMLTIFTPR